MKTVISGKRYDTDTAVVCGIYGDRKDSDHYIETLYQKRTGEFFIHGEGGPDSKYREAVTLNEWRSGEKITPLTEGDAKEWAKNYLTADEYKRIFEIVDKPEICRKHCTFSLTGNTIAKLTELARSSGLSRSQIVADLINDAYEERKKVEH